MMTPELKRCNVVLPMALILILTLSGAVSAEKRTALVIGNGAYKSAPLANAVNDATDMKTLLEKLQFEVIFRPDADKGTMLKAMEQFNKKLKRSDVGLFYFAGHGMQINGENYLIPVRTHITSEIDVEYAALAAGRVLGKMKDTATRVNIIILDACRDNPFKRSFRTTSKGLAQMNAPTGSIIAYATAPGDVAADGNGRNGLYTSQLMKHIQTPGISIERVFKLTRNDVIQSAEKMGFKQVPWEASSMTGDFYFASGTTMVEGSQVPAASRPSFGSLQVLSRPSGARISLNNVDKGIAPVVIEALSPGSYQITGQLSGYQSLGKQVSVNPGRRAMLTLYLDPVNIKAKLFVIPKPVDARIRIMNISDKYYNGIELEPGRYKLEVSSTGHITKTQWIDIGTSGAASGGIDLYVELEEELNQGPETGPVQGPKPGQVWKEPVTYKSDTREARMYTAAKTLLNNGDSKGARKEFEAFIKTFSDSANADNAQFWIADSYYGENWYEKAIMEYQKVINNYPSGNKVPTALLKQGYAFANLGEKGNARLILKELIRKYAGTGEAKFAKEKLEALK